MHQALHLVELGREALGVLVSLEAREGRAVGRLGAAVLGADLRPCQPGKVQSVNQGPEPWAGSPDTWLLVLPGWKTSQVSLPLRMCLNNTMLLNRIFCEDRNVLF